VTTKVLYIMATGRSGTTILDNVLGSLPGFFSGGEIHLIWKALLRRSGCGCGRPVAECDLWTHVIERLSDHARGYGTDPALFDHWRRSETRIMHTPRLLLIGPGGLSKRPILARYSELLSGLYRSVAAETGARVIVDSSKTPANALLLSMMDDIDLYVVHVVRDPRAVAHSWQRRRPTFDPHRPEEMHHLGPVRSSLRWLATNLLAEAVRRRLPTEQYLRLRYEDFVDEPRTEIGRLQRFAQEGAAAEPFIDDRTVLLHDNHTVWGNRSRYMTGEVTLRHDEEWIQRASLATRSIATALTMPLLLRYRYKPIARQRL
jgi:sulfotransferase family protein